MVSKVCGELHVLVVHFNTPTLTTQLVREIPKRTRSGRAILVHVLDNCSDSGNITSLVEELHGLPNVTLDISKSNLGFGEGINLLVDLYVSDSADILWILNPDTLLQPGCLDQLEDELVVGDFAVVSPLIFSGHDADRWIWYCGGTVDTRKLKVGHQLYAQPLAQAPSDTFETEFITGAAPMMRLSTFQSVGGFPSDYFLYWEDVYFSHKARSVGLRLGVVASAHLWHAVGGSSGLGESETFYYWTARNRFLFARDLGVPMLRLITGRALVQILRSIAKPLLLESNGRLAKTRAAMRGTLAGIKALEESSRRSVGPR